MERAKCLPAAVFSTLLLLSLAACSGNKVAEHSSLDSKADGKGTAPSSALARQADRAMVRFVNGTSGPKNLAFGDVVVFSGVKEYSITEFKEIPAERHEFKLTLENDPNRTIATDSEGLSAGKRYTVIASAQKDGTAKLSNMNDDLTPPSAGRAKVRVIDLAPNIKSLTLVSGDKKDIVFSHTGLNSPTEFKEVDPTRGPLSLEGGTSKRDPASAVKLDMKAGKLYTILAFEDKTHSLKTKVIEDEFTATPNGVAK